MQDTVTIFWRVAPAFLLVDGGFLFPAAHVVRGEVVQHGKAAVRTL